MRSAHPLSGLLAAALLALFPVHAQQADAGVELPLPASPAAAEAESVDSEASATVEPAPVLGTPDDAPRYAISRGNSTAHAAMLSPGQRALVAALPDSFRMPVHPASAPYLPPPAFAADTQAAAGKARIDDSGTLVGLGRGLPFPEIDNTDPQGGLKAIWNHLLRWRGTGRTRHTQMVVMTDDMPPLPVDLQERSRFLRGIDAEGPERTLLLAQQLFGISAPPRLAGNLKLIHEARDGTVKAWQRSPGPSLSSLKPTTEVGADTAVIGSDGLYDEDQREGFSGSPDGWRWKLVARHDLLVPWAADRFTARDRPLDAVLGPRHPDPSLLRYEPRRVLQLDARLASDRSSAFPRRSYYIDEASWQVLLVEFYGRDDRLQRVQEVHVRQQGDVLLPAVEVVYDLPTRRYLVIGLEAQAGATALLSPSAEEFQPGRAVDWAKSVGAVPAKR